MSAVSGLARRGRVRLSLRVAAGALVVGLVAQLLGVPAVAAQQRQQSARSSAALVAERPDRPSAMLTARVQGSRVEILSERTETSSTYANPDGTLTTEQYAGPIRFRDGAGSWRDIDLTLEQAADGSVRARAHPLGLALAGPGGAPGKTRDLVTLAAGGRKVRLGWRGPLPRPMVGGTRATYPDVLPDVDLVVEATRTGFEQSLVVKSRPADPAALALALPMVLQALTAQPRAGGGVELVGSDGRAVGLLAEPVMWDAQVEAQSGVHRHRAAVGMTVTGSGAAVEVRLVPDVKFLLDPATVYPVTIDPSYGTQLFPTFDTWVEVGYGDESASNELRLGTHDDGTNISRSFLNLNMSPFAGKDIISANLYLWEWHSWSCQARTWHVRATTPASTATRWTAQPTWYPTIWASPTQTRGYDASCADGWVSADVTNLLQTWADQSSGAVAIGLKAADETDPYAWKRFNSGNAASNIPKINITYDSYPNTASNQSTLPATACASGTSRPWINTTTPTLQAAVSDPDGGTVYGNFDVHPTGNPTSIWSGTSAGVTSGGMAAKAVAAGALANGGTYSWRVRAYDGLLYSKSWTSYCEFSIDTVKPATPGISSTAYPQGQWNPTGGAGTFTFTSSDTGSGVGSWRYWLDSATPSTVTGASPTSVSITPPNGWHILHVQAVDKAGNLSDDTTYSFGAIAGVTSPTAGQRTQRFVTLGAIGPSAATGVRFQYQLPGTTTWTDIPTAHVTLAGAPVGSWPVATVADTSAARAPANLVWDVRATMSNVDGPIIVRAVVSSATSLWTTDAITTTLDQKAFGDSYATTEIGPGTVSLLTGNYSVSATDVSITAWGSDLTVARTFNALSPTATGVLGPGWQSTLAVQQANAKWTKLTDTGSGVVLTAVDGGLTVFAKSGSGYVPQGDAAGLALTKTTSPDEFTLTDLDGTASTFAFVSGPATPTLTSPRLYRVSRVTQPGSNQVTTYAYNADGTPAQILAPKPTAATMCDQTNWSPGCRALQLSYTGGKLAKITIKTTDGAGAVKVADAACYSYDANGRLWQAWDPRMSGTTCGSPVLATTYTYDAAGRLATVTPAGLAGSTIGYDAQGRLATVSRTHDAAHGGGSETTTLRYDVPFGAAGSTDASHPDLSAGRVAAWAQTDLPVTATAVFGPGDTVSSTDLRDGDAHALDVNGREVNTAGFSGTGQAGWRVSTAEYDQYGNQIRTLSAGNRDTALTGDPTSLGLPAGTGTAAFAQALDERSSYSADGVDLLDTYGPLHGVAIDGAWVNARQHTHVTYGTLDAPGTDPTVNGPKHLEIQRTVAASLSAATTPTSETDLRTTRTAYGLSGDATGWTLMQPMRVTTVVPGGQDIVRETLYNATTGLVTQSRMPSAAGSATAVGTTRTTYYAAGARNDPGCVNSAWVNLICKVEPGSQPTTAGLPKLPVRQTTYDWLGRPTTQTETVVDAAGATKTRTTITEYESSGWSPRLHRRLVSGTVGTAVPAVVQSYDLSTGLLSAVGTDSTPTPGPGMAGSISIGYDDFGRVTSFTDADGATTLASYTAAGRAGTVTTRTPAGVVIGVMTFGYDAATEHRGLPTSVSDSGLSGAVTGSYDADGSLAGQTFPNGMTQTITRDATGAETRVVYAKGGVEWVNDSQSPNIHGQSRWHWGPAGWELYGYDPAGRLGVVWDQRAGQSCVQRGYDYDVDSNRTASHAWPANATGDCPPGTTPTATTHAYDAADRLLPQGVDAGLADDAFGRTTTLPASAAGGTAASTAYYVTDTVAGQTQGSATRSWTLDPFARLRRATSSEATTRVSHYADASDSPSWIDENAGAATLSATRYVSGLDGNLLAAVAVSGATSSARWQLSNLHGDIVTTVADDPALTTPDGPTLDADEYGNPRSGAVRYGWLGANQRSTESLAGLTLMGARLYSPVLGRFLQVDPVIGGSCNAYDYVCADPVNATDLDGCTRCGVQYAYWTILSFDFAVTGWSTSWIRTVAWWAIQIAFGVKWWAPVLYKVQKRYATRYVLRGLCINWRAYRQVEMYRLVQQRYNWSWLWYTWGYTLPWQYNSYYPFYFDRFPI
jgi:RHS repeat-associated protein